MRRKLNFTGRMDIAQNRFRIVVADGNPRTFNATLDLDDLNLPRECRIYLEAFSSGSRSMMRFPWGTIGSQSPCEDRRLSDIEGDSISFDVKIVDESTEIGKLVAVSRDIRGRAPGETEGSDSGRMSILPVNAVDLGERVWRLAFNHDNPWLEVNNRISGISEIARTDKHFFALVYPQAIRQILMQILIIDAFFDCDGSLDDWKVQWLRWGIHWHPDNARPEQDADQEMQLQWIEDVIEIFCKKHQTATGFMESLSAEGGRR